MNFCVVGGVSLCHDPSFHGHGGKFGLRESRRSVEGSREWAVLETAVGADEVDRRIATLLVS